MHFAISVYDLLVQIRTFKFTGKSEKTKIFNDLPADVLTEYGEPS
jgi:hypothetical protein